MPLPHVPPLWREGLMGLEAASLVRDPVWRGVGVEHGKDRPVLLIPGFLAGDGSLALMTRWLRANGYRTHRAGMRAHVDCSKAVCDRLEGVLEEMYARRGQRVTIIGQSRGGITARALGTRRPDLVAGIITLGSPVRSMLDVHPAVLGGIAMVGALGSLRMAQCFTWRCLRGECCSGFREDLAAPFPDEVGYVAVYSKRDGIVNWRSCLDPDADDAVEVRSSHCGMAVHPDVYRVLGDSLASFGGENPAVAWDAVWAQAA